MSDKKAATGPDYSETLFLPKTDFPMRAGLPQKEPQILKRWEEMDLYGELRKNAVGRPKYVLHDGPPYANGNLHIGHALNKILKDVITRSRQMSGFDSNYVPGWDCHGLPIEWKIEEQYRARGRNKDEVPVNEFRRECREFAAHWVGVQAAEFERLGVVGDFKHPYKTMDFASEAVIAGELMKFALSDQLYRGSKPIMWSVVEKTALAEAEVEYHDYQSDTIWVKFPVTSGPRHLRGASVVIWTTTPWTIPANRAISYSGRVAYGLYEVTEAAPENWAKVGDRLILADALAADVMKQARVEAFKRVGDVTAEDFTTMVCAHPLRDAGLGGYGFDVPLLEGEHVTEDAGTGFVHTAPGHGREDFEVWMSNRRELEASGVDTTIPYTVDGDGALTKDAPGFEGRRVLNDKGEKGDANGAVIEALSAAGRLVARGRLKHQYPHSWRSKKPVIFRNTPQWFIHMDRDIAGEGDTLRARALKAIEDTTFTPVAGQNRLRGMIANRPDWVVSRQRAWGVPIAVFIKRETGEVLKDEGVNQRIVEAFRAEGADAWFAAGAKERFLGNGYSVDEWDKVDDILDVWFDSGSTHAFVLEQRPDLKWPADLYLEGSDQHRGWFHSSLLESCGTRGRAPYDGVLTHGFVMDEEGRKMSKSLGNVVTPQQVIDQSGADILRLWVVTSDYSEDLRIGPEILKTSIDSYRKLRNTVRWMLGTLAHFDPAHTVAPAEMPELERLMLSELARLDGVVREAYEVFDFKRIAFALFNFMTVDLSAFYFDVRKDVLYCDPASSKTRLAALTVVDRLFDTLVAWLAPLLPFTCEEAWLDRHPEDRSVHLTPFPDVPAEWRDEALEGKWERVRTVRRVITGALEVERREKRIGSSLEAAPRVFIADESLRQAVEGIDLAEMAITSQLVLEAGVGPAEAFRLSDVPGVAVVPDKAEGRRCARSWKVLPEVGADPDFPDLTPRDAAAMREYQAMKQAAE
ncbi:Isoleucyl-tRNA synthetase [Faunimonas pinastri]|uniref:Isoleucine--tRNA ligase n=1 Tax=Faunimonas pinastri TaxID=1855383 RepID=A0A1H8ZK25_9HYPH|nr:isoleucine--tRNA ligase [Faunimonas pinastri]SEP64859.1 Isoleucyl-tRNA synthetase [Faunimonas pinastri]